MMTTADGDDERNGAKGVAAVKLNEAQIIDKLQTVLRADDPKAL